MEFFKGKAVLMLSVKFFNYEDLIRKELSLMGANVDLFDERPSNSFYSKAIIRFKKSLYQRRIDRYFHSIIQKIEHKKYNFFFLIKGEAVPVFFLEFLKSNNPGIVFIYYTYDSFKNNPNGLSVLSFFDKKFTFDRVDAGKYNLSFRPLFFDSEYANIINEKNVSFDYDLSFIGTAHSDRYSLSQQLACLCRDFGLSMFNFYYSPSRILFRFKNSTDRKNANFDKNKISFSSLTHKEIIEVYKKSKAILDINHPGQSGLTMRTFETLGSGRKLITTNEDIMKYPFYNANNIYVIDRNNPKLKVEFFEDDFQKIDSALLYSMSLKGWLFELFKQESDIWKI